MRTLFDADFNRPLSTETAASLFWLAVGGVAIYLLTVMANILLFNEGASVYSMTERVVSLWLIPLVATLLKGLGFLMLLKVVLHLATTRS